MSSATSDCNSKTLDAAIKLRKNLNYIEKFGLPVNVAQHINYHFILNDIHIKNSTIASNVKLNS